MPSTRPMRAIAIKTMNPTVTSSIAVFIYTGDGGQYHPCHSKEESRASRRRLTRLCVYGARSLSGRLRAN
jgi:hypothetical protein